LPGDQASSQQWPEWIELSCYSRCAEPIVSIDKRVIKIGLQSPIRNIII